MDNHFNNDETRRVPLPGSESPVPEQFTPEHFDDDREPKFFRTHHRPDGKI